MVGRRFRCRKRPGGDPGLKGLSGYRGSAEIIFAFFGQIEFFASEGERRGKMTILAAQGKIKDIVL